MTPAHNATTPRHDLTTHMRPVTDLKPHPRNARNGDTDAIVASMETNGIYKPIVTTKDGTILVGNHTYAAAMARGEEELATITLSLDPFSGNRHP